MHENLKFTLKLDETITAFESLKISSNPSIEEKAQISDWQPVFSETNYGTHYLVYAKFLGQKVDETSFKVGKVQLYLQNYVGDISLGLTGHIDLFHSAKDTDDPDFNDPRFPDREKYKLQIGLQALNSEAVLEHFEPKAEVIFKTGDIIQTDAFFLPVDTGVSKIFEPGERHTSCFVDQMFMERNGDEIFVTSKGESRLRELAAFEHIDTTLLAKIKIDINKNQSGTDAKEERGRSFPCQPTSSIVHVN